jgi:hypothetical protein
MKLMVNGPSGETWSSFWQSDWVAATMLIYPSLFIENDYLQRLLNQKEGFTAFPFLLDTLQIFP